jgi:acetyl esterase/lipase
MSLLHGAPSEDDDEAGPPQMPLPMAAAVAYAERVTALGRALPPEIVRTRGRYGDDPPQRYDVYTRRGLQDAPVLVFWHGGGWTNGYPHYARFMAEHVTALGMVLVTPGYRLAPAHRMPDVFADALACLADVLRNVASLGGDPKNVYLSGHSAGGHIAALTALRQDDAAQAGVDTTALRGCLPISGIMDLHHPAPASGSLEERVYSMVLDDPLTDAAYSPLCWTAGTRMPMVLTCGENDSARVLSSNRRMAAVLALRSPPSSLHVEPGLDHFSSHLVLADAGAAWYTRLEALVSSTSSPSPSSEPSP